VLGGIPDDGNEDHAHKKLAPAEYMGGFFKA